MLSDGKLSWSLDQNAVPSLFLNLRFPLSQIMAGKLQKKMLYEKDVVCSSEKPVLERPTLSWEANINLNLWVRECDSVDLIAVTPDKRSVNAAMKSLPPPGPKMGFCQLPGRILASQERLGFMELVSVTFMSVSFFFFLVWERILKLIENKLKVAHFPVLARHIYRRSCKLYLCFLPNRCYSLVPQDPYNTKWALTYLEKHQAQ